MAWSFNWARWRPRWRGASQPPVVSEPKRSLRRAVAHDPFEQALARLAAEPDGGAGRLRVVSLADFRAAVGDKWLRLADKVAIIAEAVIQRHIGSGNQFRRQGDDLWLLAFLMGDAETARTAAAQVAQDLSRHLLGDACIGGERPVAVVAHVAAACALDARGTLDHGAVRAAIDECRSLMEMRGEAGPAWRPLVVPGGRRPAAPAWRALHWAHGGERVDEPWDTVPPLPADAHLRLVWRPTWVAEGEAISAYSARIVRLDHAEAEPLEGPLAYPAADENSALRLDRFVTAAALADLAATQAAGRQASVILPLSWSTLHHHGAQLLQPFAELPEDTRRQRVRIEVFRLPDDASADELEAVVAFARKLCGDVLVRLRLGSPLIDRIGALGAGHVGLDLSELRPAERMGDELLLSTLAELQDNAVRAGAGCYLWSARRRRVVGGAVRNGFEMVNGPGLMRDIARPAAIVPAPRDRFTAAPCAPAR